MKYYQLTLRNKKFAETIAEEINKDYPGVAKVKFGCCYVKQSYYDKCCDYVLKNCKIERE